MTDLDDWDDYDPYLDDPAEQAAAEDRALDRHIEEQAAGEYQEHCDEAHGGLACDCPHPEWPACRWWLRVPRWGVHHGWQCGTKGCCLVALCRSPVDAWRNHRRVHLNNDEPPF